MHNRTILVLLIGIAAGCAGTDAMKETVDKAAGETRTITLTKGDTLATKVSASGDVTVTVKILEGKPNAGTYTTTSEALLDNAREARNALGKSGATVWIRVDEENQIAVIGWGQYLK
ncbi:MAG: hypothetical protein ACYSUN_08890 [Planctomycetota bacterium]|jgi:hypothetical protein